jgi:hypothetical protein
VREATATGRACGSEEFVREIEVYSGRCMRPQKRGRKPRPPDVDETREALLPSRW